MNCTPCEKKFLDMLSFLPRAWAEQIATAICSKIVPDNDLDCDDFKDCETVTSLSQFIVNGTEVCITYKDENSISITRCFDFKDIINASMDGVDPKCLMSRADWDLLTWIEKWQAIIDKTCDDCGEVNPVPSGPNTLTMRTTVEDATMLEIWGIPGVPHYVLPDPVTVDNPVTINIPAGFYTIMIGGEGLIGSITVGQSNEDCDPIGATIMNTEAVIVEIPVCTDNNITVDIDE